MEENENIELIQKYIHHLLTDDEEKQLHQKLNSDKDFAEEFEMAVHLNAKSRAQRRAHYKQLISDNNLELSEAPKQYETDKKRTTKVVGLPVLLRKIAATLAILFVPYLGYSIYLNASIKNVIAEALNNPYPAKVTLNDNGDNAYKIAMSNFQAKKYDEAIKSFNSLLKTPSISTNEKEEEFEFYLGLSYMSKTPANFEKAILYFDKNGNSRYKEAAEWYKAICLQQTNKTNEAKLLLKNIIANKQWKADEANALLQKLEQKKYLLF